MWRLSYIDKMTGAQFTDLIYEFDADKGFAPVRLYGITNKTTDQSATPEMFFHCHRTGRNVYAVDSVLAYSSSDAKQKKIVGEVYLINSWSNKVAEKDLMVKLPKKYLLIDERFGEASPIFKIINGNSSTKPASTSGGGRDQ